MSSIFGKNIKISLFGESHGQAIGVVIDGLKAGLKLNFDEIDKDLSYRSSNLNLFTERREPDKYEIISGYFNGFTTGTPLTFLIKNEDIKSSNYEKNKDNLRPSHADYTAYKKYYGFQDYRGGGHFSGRLTAPLVIAGSICKQILNKKQILIASHIKQIYNLKDDDFDYNKIEEQINILNKKSFATLSKNVEEKMKTEIQNTKNSSDSIGGMIETVIIGNIIGIGDPFFDSVESVLSSLIFSIPGIKGVEFGLGFDFANKKGSEVNDEFYCDNKQIKTKTNNNGGINGGIANGMPIVIKSVVKPTPSIAKVQKTVNYQTMQEVDLKLEGRFDSCIVPRARIVVDSVVAIGILDLLVTKYGYEWMEM